MRPEPLVSSIKVMDVASEGGMTTEEVETILGKHDVVAGTDEERALLKKLQGIFRYYKNVFGRSYGDSTDEKKELLDANSEQFEKIYKKWRDEAGKV